MSQQPLQRKLARTRTPRVHITYASERAGAEEQRELPYVVGVLADFAGDRREAKPLHERRFRRVDLDSLDDFVASVAPGVELDLPGGPTRLAFGSMRDFEPPALAAQLRERPEGGALDLAARLARVYADPAFRRLEAAWRGLEHLVTQTESGPTLWVAALDVSKEELLRDLQRAPEPDQSALFKKVYEEAFGTPGGTPFALLVGGHAFSHHPRDVELLAGLAAISAVAHAPFVAQAAPELFGLASFDELAAVRSPSRIFESVEYARWNSFRGSEDARWVALTAPRVLSRRPHVWSDGDRGAGLFQEVEEGSREGLAWGSAAFHLAARVAGAFAREGWPARIQGVEGGGLVQDLPTWTVAGAAGERDKICVECRLSDRSEFELSDLGIVPLVGRPEPDRAVFFSVPSCHRPRAYEQAAATGNARVLSRLPTLLGCARFAHYLKVIARDRLGSFHERGDYQRLLGGWLQGYVGDPTDSTPEAFARHPLSDAQLEVIERPGVPGRLCAVVHLKPRLLVAELEVSLRMMVDLPTL